MKRLAKKIGREIKNMWLMWLDWMKSAPGYEIYRETAGAVIAGAVLIAAIVKIVKWIFR